MHEHLNWVRRYAASLKTEAKSKGGDQQLESRAKSIEDARYQLVHHRAAKGKIDLLAWLGREKGNMAGCAPPAS